MSKYIHHEGLFHTPYLARVLSDPKFPRERTLPPDADKRIKKLLAVWDSVRDRLVKFEPKPVARPFVGLPPHLRPLQGVAESVTEHDFVREVLDEVLDFATESNRSLSLVGVESPARRPDIVAFASKKRLEDASRRADKNYKGKPANAVEFCHEADLVIDAKRFAKGVGSDADEAEASAKPSKDQSAAADLQQMADYLSGCGKTWGVLTNGRSWRLMRQGNFFKHLRFDLVAWLEDLRERRITDDDRQTFGVFWHMFGPPAVGGGWLDLIYREAAAETRRVQDILRENAHEAVLIIARGFLKHPENEHPKRPSQEDLDHLRELALIFLYRLLFVLKAEAQNLLPMRDELGRETRYAKHISTAVVFKSIDDVAEGEREDLSAGFDELNRVFKLVDQGGDYGVPPYNGGLFDPERHQELTRLKLRDDVCHALLKSLIYLDGSERVPYADLDVRDLGSIYEGLLEQRLVRVKQDNKWVLALRNQKGERKATGSYFTPDSLVDHVVRGTLGPLLAACNDDPHRILDLKIVDPAMGSGHFLVKVVDVIAWHLTLRCAPIDKGVPNDNGPDEFAYWKRKVVERCVYGVDVNPMAVELAKVALWLHTASRGKPLSFLDHHLKCGNSLVGATLNDVATPGRRSKKKRDGAVWESFPHAVEVVVDTGTERAPAASAAKRSTGPAQMALDLPYDTKLFTSVLKSIHAMLARSSDRPDDVKQKGRDYDEIEKRLKAHRLLCDLWCAQWFLVEPDRKGILCYESPNGLYARLKRACDIRDDNKRSKELMQFVEDEPIARAIERARDEGYGPRLLRFFHWQLEFPEVAFDEEGHLRATFGFDAVVGNPPWDKIQSAKRDFYGPFSDDVASAQGTKLDALIGRMEQDRPELTRGWERYEARINAMQVFVLESGTFRYQVALVNGEKTGGKLDAFRLFVELGVHCARSGGGIGQVVPSTLWQGESATALRRLIMDECTITDLLTFENYRKWAFEIDSRSKFTSLVMRRAKPSPEHMFSAAFMLRDTRAIEGSAPTRFVRLSRNLIETLNPGTLTLLDLRTRHDVRLVERLVKTCTTFASTTGGWGVTFSRELNQTDDREVFRSREFLAARGFTKMLPERQPNGAWTQMKDGPGKVANLPSRLPDGGEYWISAHSDYYRDREYYERQLEDGSLAFIHSSDESAVKNGTSRSSEAAFLIFPLTIYRAVYEGRLVHAMDHAQKRYVQGEGRRAEWVDLPVPDKRLLPRVFAPERAFERTVPARAGFCDVTGQTNERSVIAAILPARHLAVHTIFTSKKGEAKDCCLVVAVQNSFVLDFLVRFSISTHVTTNLMHRVSVPHRGTFASHESRVQELVARLSCTTPELADVWNAVFPAIPWSYASAERSQWKRGEMRAELDAIVADVYGLSVEEYAYVLTTFPLLDRDQPALEGDAHVTDGDERSTRRGTEGVDWEVYSWGVIEREPRGFITRDLALLTYMKRKGHPIPDRLDEWYRDVVGFDPEGELSRFRVGVVRDLAERVERAKERGAVAYVPSGRGGDDDVPDDAE